MFTWILIAIVIAFIFGVIKVEQVKSAAKKYGPQARELLNKAKTTVEEKATEIKKNIDAKKAQMTAGNKATEATKPAETTVVSEAPEAAETTEAASESQKQDTDNQ